MASTLHSETLLSFSMQDFCFAALSASGIGLRSVGFSCAPWSTLGCWYVCLAHRHVSLGCQPPHPQWRVVSGSSSLCTSLWFQRMCGQRSVPRVSLACPCPLIRGDTGESIVTCGRNDLTAALNIFVPLVSLPARLSSASPRKLCESTAVGLRGGPPVA